MGPVDDEELAVAVDDVAPEDAVEVDDDELVSGAPPAEDVEPPADEVTLEVWLAVVPPEPPAPSSADSRLERAPHAQAKATRLMGRSFLFSGRPLRSNPVDGGRSALMLGVFRHYRLCEPTTHESRVSTNPGASTSAAVCRPRIFHWEA